MKKARRKRIHPRRIVEDYGGGVTAVTIIKGSKTVEYSVLVDGVRVWHREASGPWPVRRAAAAEQERQARERTG